MKRMSTQKTFWKKKKECPPLLKKKHFPFFPKNIFWISFSPTSQTLTIHPKISPGKSNSSWILGIENSWKMDDWNGWNGCEVPADWNQVGLLHRLILADLFLGHSLRICITFSTFCSFILLVKKKELLNCSFRQLFFFWGWGVGSIFIHRLHRSVDPKLQIATKSVDWFGMFPKMFR